MRASSVVTRQRRASEAAHRLPAARQSSSQMTAIRCSGGDLLGTPPCARGTAASATSPSCTSPAAGHFPMDVAPTALHSPLGHERTSAGTAASTSYSRPAVRRIPLEAAASAVRSPPSPGHVSLVLDGNQRWASRRGLQTGDGHQAGVHSLKAIVKACARLDVSVLTVFGFSAENWTRSHQEVDLLFDFMETTLRHDLTDLIAHGVQLKFFGDLAGLPPSLQSAIARAEEVTRSNTGLHLGVALNYGGKQDVVQAAQRIAQLVADGALSPTDVDESLVASLLQTSALCQEQGPPDLLIRTSGEMRLSNFMLWDLAYTELYFSPKYWPDFGEDDLLLAFEEYSKRDRRFGQRSQADILRPGAESQRFEIC